MQEAGNSRDGKPHCMGSALQGDSMATSLIERPLNHYPAALFVGTPPEFTCESICFNGVKDAVLCIEGHLMCRECANTWKRQSNECPSCRVVLDVLVTCRKINETIEKAEVVCFTRLDADGNLINNKNGDATPEFWTGKAKEAKGDACDWVGPLKDAEEHFKVCPFAGVRCPYAGCGALVARRDLRSHQWTCEYGRRLCKWAGCGATFALEALPAHESTCRKREVDCPNQGCSATRIAFDVLEAHLLTCEYRLLRCKWEGCGATVVCASLPAHEGTCVKRLVRCPHPGCTVGRIAFDGLAAHMAACEHRLVPCKWPGCGAKFTPDDMEYHGKTCVKRVVSCPNHGCKAPGITFDGLEVHRLTCPFEAVECPFAGVGCAHAHVLRKALDKHLRDAMTTHNELSLAAVSSLRQEVRALKEQANTSTAEARALREENRALKEEVSALKLKEQGQGSERGKEVFLVTMRHAELTGLAPFVPNLPAHPTRFYSDTRAVGGREFTVFVETAVDSAPKHFGIYLQLMSGPVPCNAKFRFELLHHDGQAGSALVVKSFEHTYEKLHAFGAPTFVTKTGRLADAAANNPYVKNGCVTFRCTLVVVE